MPNNGPQPKSCLEVCGHPTVDRSLDLKEAGVVPAEREERGAGREKATQKGQVEALGAEPACP